MRKHIATNHSFVEDTVICLFAGTGRATESIQDAKMIFVIRRAVNRVLAKGFRNTAVYSALEQTVQKGVAEPLIFDAVTTKLVDDVSFTVPVSNFVKHEVKKNFLDGANIEERFVKLAAAVKEKKIKVKGGVSTKRVDSARFPSSPTDIFYEKKTSPRPH